MTGFVSVARSEDIKEGALSRVDVNGRPILITRVYGRLCVLSAICTHEDADLSKGELEDETVWCPLHASGFNIFTGAVTSPPAEEPLEVYEAREYDGKIAVSPIPRKS
ncbi:MAG: Rieske 2Fe-2S domain-containing protein [Chloroflexi bacterium]|nr:Rieske 2Fe-2S domain-containing protein [Chloroflexota bacterium]